MTPQQQQAWAELAGNSEENSDHRVAAALDAAGDDGKVIQHLTGGPELVSCFRSGTGFTLVEQAMIRAVLDARRLGHWSPIPAAVLEKACDGYLSPRQRPGLPDWAGTAFTALTTGTRADGGSVGPGKTLTALSTVRTASGQEPGYLPDDYLAQNTSAELEDKPAPVELWDALTGSAVIPEDLERLGQSAVRQGFYWHAGRLWAKAISTGSTRYADYLVRLVTRTSPGDVDEVARWVIEHGILSDPQDTADLLTALHEAAAGTTIASVLEQRPAEHADVEDAWKVAGLIRTLHGLGEEAAARELAFRAASGSSIGDAYDVAELAEAMYNVGATAAMDELLKRAPERSVRLQDEYWVKHLLQTLLDIGARATAASLALRIAENLQINDLDGFITLVRSIQVLCGWNTAQKFAARSAVEVQVASVSEAAELIDALQDLGMNEAVSALLKRISVDQVELDSIRSASSLLQALLKAGAGNVANSLANRVAAEITFQNLTSLDDLAPQIYAICGPATANGFGARIAAHADPEDAYAAFLVTDALRSLGAVEYTAQFLERNLVHRIKLDNAFWCFHLLRNLREAGVSTAAAALAVRVAAEVSLEDTDGLVKLAAEIYVLCGPLVAKEFSARLAAQVQPVEASWLAEAIAFFQTLGAEELITELLGKNPAHQVKIDDMESVGEFLRAVRKAGKCLRRRPSYTCDRGDSLGGPRGSESSDRGNICHLWPVGG